MAAFAVARAPVNVVYLATVSTLWPLNTSTAHNTSHVFTPIKQQNILSGTGRNHDDLRALTEHDDASLIARCTIYGGPAALNQLWLR